MTSSKKTLGSPVQHGLSELDSKAQTIPSINSLPSGHRKLPSDGLLYMPVSSGTRPEPEALNVCSRNQLEAIGVDVGG